MGGVSVGKRVRRARLAVGVLIFSTSLFLLLSPIRLLYHTTAGGLCSLHSPSRIALNLLLKT